MKDRCEIESKKRNAKFVGAFVFIFACTVSSVIFLTQEKLDVLQDEYNELMEKVKTLENSINGPSSKPVLDNSNEPKLTTKETILKKIAADSNIKDTLFFKSLNS